MRPIRAAWVLATAVAIGTTGAAQAEECTQGRAVYSDGGEYVLRFSPAKIPTMYRFEIEHTVSGFTFQGEAGWSVGTPVLSASITGPEEAPNFELTATFYVLHQGPEAQYGLPLGDAEAGEILLLPGVPVAIASYFHLLVPPAKPRPGETWRLSGCAVQAG